MGGEIPQINAWRRGEYCVTGFNATTFKNHLYSRKEITGSGHPPHRLGYAPAKAIAENMLSSWWQLLTFPALSTRGEREGCFIFWSACRIWGHRSGRNKLTASRSHECSGVHPHQFQGEGIRARLSSCHCSPWGNEWGSVKETGIFWRVLWALLEVAVSSSSLEVMINNFCGLVCATGMGLCFARVVLFNSHNNYTRQTSYWCPALGSLQNENNCKISKIRSWCLLLSKSHNCQEFIIVLSKKCLTVLNI